jgi:hypothetical protein
MSRARGAIVVGSIGLVLAGCGSSGSNTHYLAQANAICRAGNQAIEALPAPGNSAASFAAVAKRELPIVSTEVSKLAALSVPSGKQAGFDKAVSDAKAEIALVNRFIPALTSGNKAELSKLGAQATKLSKAASADTKAAGLKDCATNAQPQGQG